MKRILVLVLLFSLFLTSPAFADTIKIITELGKTYEVAGLRFVKHDGGSWTLILTNGRDLALKNNEIRTIILPGAKPTEFSPEEMQSILQQSQTRSLEGLEKNTKTIAFLMIVWSVFCAIATITVVAQ